MRFWPCCCRSGNRQVQHHSSSQNFNPLPSCLETGAASWSPTKTEIPLTLRILESGDVHAQLGAQMKMLWNDVIWRDGYLRGRMPGDIGTEDAARRPYFLSFSLKLSSCNLFTRRSASRLPFTGISIAPTFATFPASSWPTQGVSVSRTMAIAACLPPAGRRQADN